MKKIYCYFFLSANTHSQNMVPHTTLSRICLAIRIIQNIVLIIMLTELMSQGKVMSYHRKACIIKTVQDHTPCIYALHLIRPANVDVVN